MELRNKSIPLEQQHYAECRSHSQEEGVHTPSKPFITEELATLGRKCQEVTKKKYKLRRDSHNHEIYKKAVEEYGIAFDKAQCTHWQECDPERVTLKCCTQ